MSLAQRQQALSIAIQIAERLWAGDKKSVMVALYASPESKRRHLRLYRDQPGLYVRLGRRGLMKRYLKEMAGARIVDVSLDLAVFYEY